MITTPRIYKDRLDAGRYLARVLMKYAGEKPLVLGLPRGGVVVAAEIARMLKCDLDVIMAGKLRAPFNSELAIGAVTEDGLVYLNEEVAGGIHEDYIEKEREERLQTIRTRLGMYRKVKKKIPCESRTVIIADDGLATGATMISAVQGVIASKAKKTIVAVPGGPADTVGRIRGIDGVDEVICPLIPSPFYAVSQLYIDFRQVEDSEVIEILKRSGKEDA